MRYDPQKHHRRSIRLKGYDYTRTGAYFVTLVTHRRECLFGEVVEGEMRLNPPGEIVREEWFRSAEIRAEIELFPEEFVVMPNHIHGIVWIVDVADPPVGTDDHAVDRDRSRGDRPVAPTPVAPTPVAPTPVAPTPVAPTSVAPTPVAPTSISPGRSPLPPPPRGPAPRSLGAFIAGFKSIATKRINALRDTPGMPVWQRNYWEHIIRNERALHAIRRYIAANPSRWQLDRYNAHAIAPDPWAGDLQRLL